MGIAFLCILALGYIVWMRAAGLPPVLAGFLKAWALLSAGALVTLSIEAYPLMPIEAIQALCCAALLILMAYAREWNHLWSDIRGDEACSR